MTGIFDRAQEIAAQWFAEPLSIDGIVARKDRFRQDAKDALSNASRAAKQDMVFGMDVINLVLSAAQFYTPEKTKDLPKGTKLADVKFTSKDMARALTGLKQAFSGEWQKQGGFLVKKFASNEEAEGMKRAIESLAKAYGIVMYNVEIQGNTVRVFGEAMKSLQEREMGGAVLSVDPSGGTGIAGKIGPGGGRIV